MRTATIIASILFAAASACAASACAASARTAQSGTDSSTAADSSIDARRSARRSTRYASVTEPLRNRLFIMGTGEVMQRGEVEIGMHEFLMVTATAAPFDWLQIDGSVAPFVNRNFSAGVKVPIVADAGLVRGIAVAADVRTRGLYYQGAEWSCTLSGSFGTRRAMLHASVTGLTAMTSPIRPRRLQFGGSVAMPDSTAWLVAETMLTDDARDAPQFAPALTMFGIRWLASAVTLEGGMMIIHEFDVIGHGTHVQPLPYLGASLRL